jgi:hypothetical protein
MHPVILFLALCLILVPTTTAGASDDSPVTDKNFVPITDIVKVVETSLQVVQTQLQPTDPHLKSAEFDFQTVTTKDTTAGFFASIVTVQAEHKKVATREVDFTYSVPDKQKALLKLQSLKRNLQRLKSNQYEARLGSDCTQDIVSLVKCLWNGLHQTTDPETIAETLPGAIVAAAQAARNVSSVKNAGGTDLNHREFTIILTYQVNNSFTAGADPSSLISVGPQLKFSDETDRTQTLKLTFEDPPK